MTKRATLSEAEIAFVAQQRVAHLATANAEGRPHVIPVCYACDSVHFYIALDEKPKRVAGRQLRRVRNIEVRPAVSLVIDRYTDDWSRLGYVLIQGQAQIIDPGSDLHAHALILLRERYSQYRTMALETNPVISIIPGAITSWGAILS